MGTSAWLKVVSAAQRPRCRAVAHGANSVRFSVHIRPIRSASKPLSISTESFGRRVAKLRADLGWTQAQLATRIAVSRVALSHLEADVSVPSERTVTLLAGVFGCEPYELVAGTAYPPAKAERLPVVTARHTEVEHQLEILAALLGLVERAPAAARDRLAEDVRSEWRSRLVHLLEHAEDPEERHRVRAALRGLATEAVRRPARPDR